MYLWNIVWLPFVSLASCISYCALAFRLLFPYYTCPVLLPLPSAVCPHFPCACHFILAAESSVWVLLSIRITRWVKAWGHAFGHLEKSNICLSWYIIHDTKVWKNIPVVSEKPTYSYPAFGIACQVGRSRSWYSWASSSILCCLQWLMDKVSGMRNFCPF